MNLDYKELKHILLLVQKLLKECFEEMDGHEFDNGHSIVDLDLEISRFLNHLRDY